MKHELQLRYDWTTRSAFETIDSLREGALNNRNIQSFLKINGFYATESELVAIIRRLDVDADQKITYDEFIDAMRPQVVTEEPGYLGTTSASIKSPSRFEEEKKSTYSPTRIRSPLRESRFSETQGSMLGVPSHSSTYKAGSSPSRFDEPRQTHSSPIRPNVSRDLYSKSSTQKSPSRYMYSSPTRGGSSSLVSSYGQQQRRSSPLKSDDEEELVRAFKEQISLEKELEDAKIRLVQ